MSKDPIGFRGGLNFYAYCEDDPINCIDPSGLLTEVIFWEPAGAGASSFGHVSIAINGTSYSWGPGGMDIEDAGAYLDRNTAFRSGRGLILGLSPSEERDLAKYLRSAAPANEPYSAVTNNCTDPIETGLYRIGRRSSEMNSLMPSGLALSLLPLAIGETAHEGPPRSGFSPPWSDMVQDSYDQTFR